MFFRKVVKDYLIFSKKERIAILCILLLILGIYFLPRFFSRPPSTIVLHNNHTAKQFDSLRSKDEEAFSDDRDKEYLTFIEPQKEPAFVNGALFQFDPNTLDMHGWKRLGLNEKTAKTILNYRSKGGTFYKPEDLMRIWGMPEGFYERVKDHIAITSVQRNNYEAYEKTTYAKPEKKAFIVSINEADTSAFIDLPGIGSKLAARIVSFREKLGGFYSIEQVGETYGLPDSTFQKIKSKLTVGGDVKKININTATKDELKVHPYIKWNLANAIVEYRNQHGAFKNLDELKNLAMVDEAIFKKIVNYLSL
jgi:competence protein ComEA